MKSTNFICNGLNFYVNNKYETLENHFKITNALIRPFVATENGLTNHKITANATNTILLPIASTIVIVWE